MGGIIYKDYKTAVEAYQIVNNSSYKIVEGCCNPRTDCTVITENIVSHFSAWKAALGIAYNAAYVNDIDINNKAYWDHEIKALEKIYCAACRLGF